MLINPLFGKYLPAVQRQILTDRIFTFGQQDLFFPAKHFLCPKFKLKYPDRHPVLFLPRLSPQMCRHTGTQLSNAKRFRDIIIAAVPKSLHQIALLGLRREKQDRAVHPLPDISAKSKTVLAGHHHIQKDQIKQIQRHGLRLYGIRLTRHLMPLFFQCPFHKRADLQIIIYDQYFTHHTLSLDTDETIKKVWHKAPPQSRDKF